MTDQLNVENREETGTLRMRRLRKAGKIPAVLYGHGQDTVHLQVLAKDVQAAIRHGSQFVELKGSINESALIKEVQWDAFGSDVLHLDLARVDAGEAVEVSLTVELVGDAPGSRAGGMIRHQLHEIEIRCPASVLPEKLELKINDLELGQSLAAADIPLPAGASLKTAADEIVVQCIETTEVPEPEEVAEAGPAEPEVIGRKSDDDESED